MEDQKIDLKKRFEINHSRNMEVGNVFVDYFAIFPTEQCKYLSQMRKENAELTAVFNGDANIEPFRGMIATESEGEGSGESGEENKKEEGDTEIGGMEIMMRSLEKEHGVGRVQRWNWSWRAFTLALALKKP